MYHVTQWYNWIIDIATANHRADKKPVFLASTGANAGLHVLRQQPCLRIEESSTTIGMGAAP
jgi:hypothetical protein